MASPFAQRGAQAVGLSSGELISQQTPLGWPKWRRQRGARRITLQGSRRRRICSREQDRYGTGEATFHRAHVLQLCRGTLSVDAARQRENLIGGCHARWSVIINDVVRLLCLSDIHGHAAALAAVLATAERRGYQRILVAGDICFPGPAPLETWRRLTQLGALCVQGVGDRALATLEPDQLHPRSDFEETRLKRLLQVREELGPRILSQLAKLPQVARLPLSRGQQLQLVHGSPNDPLEPITHDMSDQMIESLLGEEAASVVLCGGSHTPFDRVITRSGAAGAAGQVRVINVGSVGEAPGAGEIHETRFAHATFVESTDSGIEVEQFVVPLGRAA